jgi:hypothetical protein
MKRYKINEAKSEENSEGEFVKYDEASFLESKLSDIEVIVNKNINVDCPFANPLREIKDIIDRKLPI